MAYDDVKQLMGKQPVYIVELKLPKCKHAYGSAPCTAVGDPFTKCFNTLSTCQDTINYDDEDTYLTIRLSNVRVDGLQEPGDPPTFPTLTGVSTAPTVLQPGKGLGIRSTVTARLTDHPWTDVGVDPYRGDREGVSLNGAPYVPENFGTLWGKLIARNTYYENSQMLVHTGYFDENGEYDPANFRVRRYDAFRIAGPDSSGQVTIEGKDPLKAADPDRAQWPEGSRATLILDLDDTTTSFQIDDPDRIVKRYVDDYSQEYLIIDKEVMKITSIILDTGTVYDVTVVRASQPAIYEADEVAAASHSANAAVQQCFYFDGERVDDVVYFLLTEGAGIDPSFVPLSVWSDFVDETGLVNYLFDTLLVKPHGIKDLLQEITELNILLWWDEREQVVRFSALVPQAAPLEVFDDDNNLIDGSVAQTLDVKNRLTRVWLHYGVRSPVLDEKEFSTYSSVKGVSDEDRAIAYGAHRERRIYSRWLSITDAAVANEIASRLLFAYRDTKRVITASLDPKDDNQWTGDRVRVQTHLVQSAYGTAVDSGYLITSVDEKMTAKGVTYNYVLQEFGTLVRGGIGLGIAPDEWDLLPLTQDGAIITQDGDTVTHSPDGIDFPDYPDASDALRNRYYFIAHDHAPDPPANPLSPPGFNDGTPAYQIA